MPKPAQLKPQTVKPQTNAVLFSQYSLLFFLSTIDGLFTIYEIQHLHHVQELNRLLAHLLTVNPWLMLSAKSGLILISCFFLWKSRHIPASHTILKAAICFYVLVCLWHLFGIIYLS